MEIPAGQRIFIRSSITNEEYEYFIPSPVSNIEASPHSVALSSALPDEKVLSPHAALMASRGNVMLSPQIIEHAQYLRTLAEKWRNRSLDVESILDLGSETNRRSGTRLAYRDSMVWVDGLRPAEAKLIPGPASTVLPLMRDYTDFLKRTDISASIKLAIAHYQILVIHPFFDGNGRLSRVLALLHAQPTLGSPRAFAIAAVLTLHRRALRKLFHEVRVGNLVRYLAYWEKLITWSDVCVLRALQFREFARAEIVQHLSVFPSPQRVLNFLIENPLFRHAQLANGLRLPAKLGLRYLDTLTKSEIIQLHPRASSQRCFRCPISVEYWRNVMEITASTSTPLLEPA